MSSVERSLLHYEVSLMQRVSFGVMIAVAAGAGAALMVLFAAAPAPSGPAAPARKCVGVFVSGERRNIAADLNALFVVGTIPCAARGVVSWSTQGVYRAFDDGSVEFLASPVPPCPEGDAFVWIRYPNP
jgi:hypothetical protein